MSEKNIPQGFDFDREPEGEIERLIEDPDYRDAVRELIGEEGNEEDFADAVLENPEVREEIFREYNERLKDMGRLN